MTSLLNMRAFPVTSSLISPLTTSPRPGSSKPSLAIPRSTKTSASASTAVLEMLAIFVCFVAGLYIATRMYGFALGLVDAELPRAFAVCFGVGYGVQLFVGWREVREEERWRVGVRGEGAVEG